MKLRILSAAAFGPFAYTSIWLQSLRGLGPIRAGLAVLPLSVASFAVSAFLGRLLHGRSPRLPVGIGMLLIGAGSLLMMLVASTSGWVVLLPGLVVSGLGVGLATPVLVSAVLATVHGHRAGIAGGAVTTFRQLGMAVGIAVLGTVVAGRIADVVEGGCPAAGRRRSSPRLPPPAARLSRLWRTGRSRPGWTRCSWSAG